MFTRQEIEDTIYNLITATIEDAFEDLPSEKKEFVLTDNIHTITLISNMNFEACQFSRNFAVEQSFFVIGSSDSEERSDYIFDFDAYKSSPEVQDLLDKIRVDWFNRWSLAIENMMFAFQEN